jgi:aryl-alcohol dehydrogenase-like predicted oxidoreductase
MQTVIWREHRLSRLTLGTAQFGMAYGIANRVGQPALSEVVALVAAAYEGGITVFDTAAAYGDSEERLGTALHTIGIADRVTVVTKVRPLQDEQLHQTVLARQAIRTSVEQSRQRLRLDCLPVVLFHREADAVYVDVLADLVAQGRIGTFGISCDHDPESAIRLVDYPGVTALQCPMNLLDVRHLRFGLPELALRRGMAIFARSAFLQGLLLLPEADIPLHLRGILPARRRLEALACEHGLTLAELALRFLLSQKAVTSVLVGVETVAQLRDNLQLAERGALDERLLVRLTNCDLQIDTALITPRLWPSLMSSLFSQGDR